MSKVKTGCANAVDGLKAVSGLIGCIVKAEKKKLDAEKKVWEAEDAVVEKQEAI